MGEAIPCLPAHAHDDVASQLTERAHLDLSLARVAGQRQGEGVIVVRAAEIGRPLPRPSPSEQDSALGSSVAQHAGGVEGPVQHLFGVAVREPERSPLARLEPRSQGHPPVFCGAGVGGDGLGVLEQRGRPTMPQDARGHRRGLVKHLLDEFVGELVARAGLDDQVRPQRALRPAGHFLGLHAEDPCCDGEVERGAQRGGRAQQLLDGRAGAAHAGKHRGAKRVGQWGRSWFAGALDHGPERLHHEQGMSARQLQDAVAELSRTHELRQPGHCVLRERTEVQPLSHALQLAERLGALLDPDRPHDQDAILGGPSEEEVKQLEG